MKHNELVARLATSNISTEDFSYLTTVLMEVKTCENCLHIDLTISNHCSILEKRISMDWIEDGFKCSKFVSKDTKGE